ncbi:hypothetical protein [Polyangium aurulentum]|uniref:hypothetical protein n=1 Tax=Polyangium aurulentum TaxID=2567896 RepID=UPI0010ADE6D3|nr:hypothetical protein [Polyangium aurulentum]UQA57429.1 hypothetical protein E8A73_040110 [Polyangium aurulentum]
MNIGTLIALAAKRVFDENEQRMGVRLSPITLTAAELTAAVRELRERLGPKAYIVGSASKVEAADLDARTYVAPDQRAAERATFWRNKVKVADKERLVYVSVETHAKANGLRDCLEQLREHDLREAFRVWASSPKSGLPSGLVASLSDADLLGTVRLAALCEFAARITSAGVKGAAAWQVVGEALPLINLACDTKLGKDDTADRLRANHALVRTLETGEGRRRSASGPLAPIEDALHVALANPPKNGRRGALASVDLGALKTPHLAKGKISKPKLAAAADRSSKGDPKPGGKVDPKKKPSKQPKADPQKSPKGGSAGIERRAEVPDSPIERVLREGREIVKAHPAPEGSPKPATRVIRLLGAPLPKGLAAMLAKLLDGSGDPVELTAKAADRSHLNDLAKTLSPEAREARRARERLAVAHSAWSEARRGLLDVARSLPAAPPLAEMLTRGMHSLLKEAAFEAALNDFVQATIALYAAAGESDERTMREVLALDTLALRGRSGDVALRIIGPLHLLSIGQTLTARRALEAVKDLPDNARRLIARALEVAPAAPGMFPDEFTELPLARGVGGLLVYERVPELVSAADASAAARAVVLRYLALCPHALLGLRVAVTGGSDLAPLVEGVAAAAQEASPRPERVEVLCARPPAYEARSIVARALEEGLMRLDALDERGARGAHITLRFAGTQGRPEDDEAAAPAVRTFAPPGGGRTTFDLRAHGLRVRTSVVGARELKAVEALTSRAVGNVPQGAFIMDVAGRSLRAECESVVAEGGWLAIVGQSLGRRPPAPWFPIAHEGFGARATCAVIAKDVRSAARSVQEGLGALGVSDMRPRSLLLLAEKLASAGRSSLVPLARPAASLVAGGLLALEMRKVLGGDVDVLIAPVTGAVYETLVGHAEEGDADTLQIGAVRVGEGLRLAIGYATVNPSPDLDTSKTQFEGAVAKRIARVAEALQICAEGARADATAAREAVAWALWTAVAVDDSTHGMWREALTKWDGAIVAPIEAILMVPPAGGNVKERGGKIGRAKAIMRPLALDRLNALLLGG